MRSTLPSVRNIEPALRLCVHVWRKRASQRRFHVLGHVIEARRAHDHGVDMGVTEGVSQNERRAALALLQEFVQPTAPETLPLVGGPRSHVRLAMGYAPTDDDADSDPPPLW